MNLATRLMLDLHENEIDAAMVVTDDFDQTQPLRLTREYFEKRLIVVSPRRSRKFADGAGADFYRPVHEAALLATRFPEMVIGQDGREVYRPSAWAA